jgi:hypothetical protein
VFCGQHAVVNWLGRWWGFGVAGQRVRVRGSSDVRCGDDDLCIYKLLVELGVLALLVRCGDERVTLFFDPRPDPELVLRRSEEVGFLLRMLATL